MKLTFREFSPLCPCFYFPLTLKKYSCMGRLQDGGVCIMREFACLYSDDKLKLEIKRRKKKNAPHLSYVGGSAPVASAVAVVTCSPRRWPVGGPLSGNRASAERPPWHRPSGRVLRKRQRKTHS